MTAKPKFTDVEAEEILERLDSGAELTHEIAARYPDATPADIWRLWDKRNRER